MQNTKLSCFSLAKSGTNPPDLLHKLSLDTMETIFAEILRGQWLRDKQFV